MKVCLIILMGKSKYKKFNEMLLIYLLDGIYWRERIGCGKNDGCIIFICIVMDFKLL